MGLFAATKEPIFLKEDSSALKQIEDLKKLLIFYIICIIITRVVRKYIRNS